MVLFFVMIWFGYVFLSDFDAVTEHQLTLQINSRFLYVSSKIVFLLTACLIVSIFGVVYPIIIALISHLSGAEWLAGVGAADFFGGLFLNFIVGSLGVLWHFFFNLTLTYAIDYCYG